MLNPERRWEYGKRKTIPDFCYCARRIFHRLSYQRCALPRICKCISYRIGAVLCRAFAPFNLPSVYHSRHADQHSFEYWHNAKQESRSDSLYPSVTVDDSFADPVRRYVAYHVMCMDVHYGRSLIPLAYVSVSPPKKKSRVSGFSFCTLHFSLFTLHFSLNFPRDFSREERREKREKKR